MSAIMDQRMAALEKANAIRFERARIKRDIRAGRRTASDLLEAGPVPDSMASMTIAELLRCVPRVGQTKAKTIAVATPIGLEKRLGTLTRRQSLELARELRARCPGERGAPVEEAQAA